MKKNTTILTSGIIAILGLAFINLTTDFKSLSPEIGILPFWIETAVLTVYLLWLIFFFLKSGKEQLPS